MAYPIAAGSICQVTFEGVHDGQQVMNLFCYKLDAVTPLADGRAALILFRNYLELGGGLYQSWQGCLSEKVTQIRVHMQWITPDRFARVSHSPFLDVGTVAGASYPCNTAVAITRSTDNAGRQNVGTVHMGGIPITFLVEASVNGLGLDAYNTLGAQSILDAAPAGLAAVFRPVHFHRTSPSTALPLTTFVTQPFTRVMRRRTVGLGS